MMTKWKVLKLCAICTVFVIQNSAAFEFPYRTRAIGIGIGNTGNGQDAKYETLVNQILVQQGEMNTALASIKSTVHNQGVQDTDLRQEMEFIKSKIFELKNILRDITTESKAYHESVHSHIESLEQKRSDEIQQTNSNVEHQLHRLELILLHDRLYNIQRDFKKSVGGGEQDLKSDLQSAEWTWKLALEQEELIKEFGSFPERICSKLNDLQEYERSLEFASQTSTKLEAALGPEHEQVLQLKICAAKATASLKAPRAEDQILRSDIDTADRIWKQTLKYDALIKEFSYFPTGNCSNRDDFKDSEKIIELVEKSSEKLENVLSFQNLYSLRIKLCHAEAKYINLINATANTKSAKTELLAADDLWKLSVNHDQLVRDFPKLALRLCSKFNEEHEFNRSQVLAEETIPRFEAIFGAAHENTLRLKLCKATNRNYKDGDKLIKSLHDLAQKTYGTNHELTIEIQNQVQLPKDCCELQTRGYTENGIYTIYPYEQPENEQGFQVYCDFTSIGGGWTVFQRREEVMGPQVDFYRDWASYESGFGNLRYSFWLGLPYISALTQYKNQSLRVELTDWENLVKVAAYDKFKVANASDQYRLTLSGYSGTAGDSMSIDDSQKFSTKDRDNDVYSRVSCAQHKKGAWWHHSCSDTNPNGIYKLKGNHTKMEHDGVTWKTLKNTHFDSLKRIEFKLRPEQNHAGCKAKSLTRPYPSLFIPYAGLSLQL